MTAVPHSSAADLPVKAPPIGAPSPASSWSGAYFGLGLGLRSSQTNETSTSVTFAGLNASAPLAANNEPLNGIGLRGTSYFGYNWQVAPRWVLGVEGDFGFANQTTTFGGLPFPAGNLGTFLNGDGIAARTTWDASARGRLHAASGYCRPAAAARITGNSVAVVKIQGEVRDAGNILKRFRHRAPAAVQVYFSRLTADGRHAHCCRTRSASRGFDSGKASN